MQDPQPTRAQIIDLINAFTAYLETIEAQPERKHMNLLTERISYLTRKVDQLELYNRSMVNFCYMLGIDPRGQYTPQQLEEIKGAIEAILNDE